MNATAIVAIATREVRAGLRNRWILLYAAVFVTLSIVFSTVAMAGSEATGQAGFGRTSAGLMNLMLFMVPLIALTVGAQTLVADRQDRTLDYLLAQPVSHAEVYFGKYIGSASLLSLMLIFGFGWSGLVLALRGTGGDLNGFLMLALLNLLLGLGTLSIGFLVSSVCTQTSAALGVAVTLWLAFVIVGDLGLMGTAVAMQLNPSTLLLLSLLNPLDVSKLLTVHTLHVSIDVLGPAGAYADDRFGAALAPMLLGIGLLWVVLPLPLAYRLGRRVDTR